MRLQDYLRTHDLYGRPIVVWERRPRIWQRIVLCLIGFVVAAAGLYYYQQTQLAYETIVFNQVTAATTSPIPTSASPGTSCKTANSSCAIQNQGMGAHWLKYCIVGGTVSTIKMELDGSDDGVNWIQASIADTTLTGTAGCNVLEAGGYFTFLRANLITLTGTSPIISAWYSGIGTAIPGGGLLVGSKPSQPVNFVPISDFGSFFTNNLKSTAQNISTSNTTIYSVNATNPNAAVSFVKMSCSGSGATLGEWAIPSNQTLPIVFNVGQSCTGTSSLNCSSSATSAVDPTNSCIVDVHFKGNVTINTGGGASRSQYAP